MHGIGWELFRSFFSKISLFSRLDTKTKAMIVPVDIPGHLPTLEVPVVVIGVARRTPAAPPPLPPVAAAISLVDPRDGSGHQLQVTTNQPIPPR